MRSPPLHVVFRVDAGSKIGLGHLGRCAALAEDVVARGGVVTFVTTTPSAISARADRVGGTIHALDLPVGSDADAQSTVELATSLAASVVVVDGYCFGSHYARAFSGMRVLWIDDEGFADERPGYVLNHNVYATPALYPATGAGRVFAGAKFALVRDDVVRLRNTRRGEASRPRVVVTMGGADPPNATSKVLDAVELVLSRRALDARVLVGSANPRAKELATRAGSSIDVLVDPPDYAAHLHWCDIAVSAAGGTCLELACLGVPFLAIAVAENQRIVASTLREKNLASVLGFHDEVDTGNIACALEAFLDDGQGRARMSALQRATIDGRGKHRVVARAIESVARRAVS